MRDAPIVDALLPPAPEELPFAGVTVAGVQRATDVALDFVHVRRVLRSHGVVGPDVTGTAIVPRG